ncbi:MAG: dehydratase [Deltaproteobacteria bacterium]|nr:dehydratase [Deltaproteobacteria bacterium]MBW2025443.1 dehydratase [Deltaproteobacteria bacterium]MBW2126900.1 dehydratase [Deltaproteobacteria bacterium]
MAGRFLEEFEVGEEFVTPARTITESDIVMFAGLSGDYSPHHVDNEFIKTLPFKGKIAHGLLGVSVCSGLIVSLDLWRETAVALVEVDVRFKGAIYVGDTIRVTLKVVDKKEVSKGGRGIVTFILITKNQKDEIVTEIRWVMMIKKKEKS